MDSQLPTRIEVVHGDITNLDVDAVVTAANQQLQGGGGVDGAVHRAAGPELVAASMALAPCPAGEARLTEGFHLRASYVIHAVGPIFRDLENDSPILASTYRACLLLAAERNVRRIAFPCISTGVYGFPKTPACEIAIRTVSDWLTANEIPFQVVFCCFTSDDQQRYLDGLKTLGIQQPDDR